MNWIWQQFIQWWFCEILNYYDFLPMLLPCKNCTSGTLRLWNLEHLLLCFQQVHSNRSFALGINCKWARQLNPRKLFCKVSIQECFYFILHYGLSTFEFWFFIIKFIIFLYFSLLIQRIRVFGLWLEWVLWRTEKPCSSEVLLKDAYSNCFYHN